MNKVIYKVEFDQVKTNEGVFADERTLGFSYEINNEIKDVLNIEEVWEYGEHWVIVHYDGGYEDKIKDISHIYRRLRLNERSS